MTLTITLTELSILLIAIAFFILVVYLIPTIIQLRQTARTIQELSEAVKSQVKELEVMVKGFGQLHKPIITLVSLITGIICGIRQSRKEGKEDVRK